MFPQHLQIKHLILVGLGLNICKYLGTQVVQVSIGRYHLKEMVELLKVAVNSTFKLSVVINVHMHQFSVLTILGVESHKLVQLQNCVRMLINANASILCLRQVQFQYPDHIVIVEQRVFQVLTVNKFELTSGQYGRYCIPLHISLVFLCVITQNNAVIIHLNEYRTHLEMKHLMHGVFGSGNTRGQIGEQKRLVHQLQFLSLCSCDWMFMHLRG